MKKIKYYGFHKNFWRLPSPEFIEKIFGSPIPCGDLIEGSELLRHSTRQQHHESKNGNFSIDPPCSDPMCFTALYNGASLKHFGTKDDSFYFLDSELTQLFSVRDLIEQTENCFSIMRFIMARLIDTQSLLGVPHKTATPRDACRISEKEMLPDERWPCGCSTRSDSESSIAAAAASPFSFASSFNRWARPAFLVLAKFLHWL